MKTQTHQTNSLLDPETKEAFIVEKQATMERLEKEGLQNVRRLDVAHTIDSDELGWHMRRLLNPANPFHLTAA